MKKTKKIDSCVLELRDLLQADLGADFVCLYHFGSRLNGTPEPESDYDVVCVTRRELCRKEKMQLIDHSLDIQFQCGVVFDLHFYSQHEFSTPPLARTPFIQEVQNEGMLV